MEEVSSKDKGASGGLLVEIIIVLGLIATMTPILYKHVSERRQDIDNINEANRLLLLKNAAREYIKENKEALATGTVVLEPIDIGVDISGYQIGIRKDSSGKIDAMIASAAGGNDLRAGKIASLLGVSAGIYSAQNTANAWGINGVWAEDISNYGFSSLPTGIPVITTAYDKEEASGLNEEQLKEFIENSKFELISVNRIQADEVCIFNKDTDTYDCRDSWDDDQIKIIQECNEGYADQCARGFRKNYNRNCSQIADAYRSKNMLATSDFYTLTRDVNVFETQQICIFDEEGNYNTGGRVVVEQCNESEGTSAACRYGYLNNMNRNCAQIISSYNNAPNKFYHLTNNTGVTSEPCVFENGNEAGCLYTINNCNQSDDYASVYCRYGYLRNMNLSCLDILSCSRTFVGRESILTLAGGGTREICTCSLVPSTVTPVYSSDFAEWSHNETKTFTTEAGCNGKYQITLMGGGGAGSGGYASGYYDVNATTTFAMTTKGGGHSIVTYRGSNSAGWFKNNVSGGSGVGICLGNAPCTANNLLMVAGGSGGGLSGGGGGGGGYLGGGSGAHRYYWFGSKGTGGYGFYANGNNATDTTGAAGACYGNAPSQVCAGNGGTSWSTSFFSFEDTSYIYNAAAASGGGGGGSGYTSSNTNGAGKIFSGAGIEEIQVTVGGGKTEGNKSGTIVGRSYPATPPEVKIFYVEGL